MSCYTRHCIIGIGEIIPHILGQQDKILHHNYNVGVSSLRLRTFARAAEKTGKICCVNCGLEATHFALEGFENSKLPSEHFNLYGIKDDNEILFTHDHIIARSLGGENNLSNTQVMCGPCNWKKGEKENKLVSAIRKDKSPQNRKPSKKQIAIHNAQQHPPSTQHICELLTEWAKKYNQDDFTAKIDTLLWNNGWKRRRVKEEIAAGNIVFDVYPLK